MYELVDEVTNEVLYAGITNPTKMTPISATLKGIKQKNIHTKKLTESCRRDLIISSALLLNIPNDLNTIKKGCTTIVIFVIAL